LALASPRSAAGEKQRGKAQPTAHPKNPGARGAHHPYRLSSGSSAVPHLQVVKCMVKNIALLTNLDVFFLN